MHLFCKGFCEKILNFFAELFALLACVHDLLRDGLRYFDVAVRLHGVLSAALSLRTQVVRVAEHFGKRNKAVYLNGAGSCFLTEDLSSSRVEVADNGSEIIIGSDYGYLHDRLKDNGVCLAHSFLECHRTGELECHFGRVYFVVRSIVPVPGSA